MREQCLQRSGEGAGVFPEPDRRRKGPTAKRLPLQTYTVYSRDFSSCDWNSRIFMASIFSPRLHPPAASSSLSYYNSKSNTDAFLCSCMENPSSKAYACIQSIKLSIRRGRVAQPSFDASQGGSFG